MFRGEVTTRPVLLTSMPIITQFFTLSRSPAAAASRSIDVDADAPILELQGLNIIQASSVETQLSEK